MRLDAVVGGEVVFLQCIGSKHLLDRAGVLNK
jgi:hypothetical protein